MSNLKIKDIETFDEMEQVVGDDCPRVGTVRPRRGKDFGSKDVITTQLTEIIPSETISIGPILTTSETFSIGQILINTETIQVIPRLTREVVFSLDLTLVETGVENANTDGGPLLDITDINVQDVGIDNTDNNLTLNSGQNSDNLLANLDSEGNSIELTFEDITTLRNTGFGVGAVAELERVPRNAPPLFNLSEREFTILFGNEAAPSDASTGNITVEMGGIPLFEDFGVRESILTMQLFEPPLL